MEKIPSFQKDHDKLEVGLHECGVTNGIVTWDLRMKKPNAGDYLTPKAMHSVEHMLATVLRNSPQKDRIVYFGPMGCRTGFYLLTEGLDRTQVVELLKYAFSAAAELTEIPGSGKAECGNYLEHDLPSAIEECKKYCEILSEL